MLFGQPELDVKLALPEIRQLAQRITFHYHLGPLCRDDVDFYVAHRLRVAGFDGARLFSRGGVSKLYKASGGIPRLINIMAHKALMVAYGEGRQQVSGRHVALAASDTLASKARFWQKPWPWLAGAGVLAAACGVSWTLLNR